MKSAIRKNQRAPVRESEVQMRPPKGGIVEDRGDKFHIDPDIIPDGMTYQWEALTVLGKENRPGMVRAMRNEWTPVPAERHPEIGGDPQAAGSAYEGAIVLEGLILMERPIEVTNYVRHVEKQKADEQIRHHFGRLSLIPDGALGDRQRNVRVSKERDLSIPEDAN